MSRRRFGTGNAKTAHPGQRILFYIKNARILMNIKDVSYEFDSKFTTFGCLLLLVS